jgi:hypothetical protein
VNGGPLALALATAVGSVAAILVAHGLVFHLVAIQRRSRALVVLFAAGLVLQVVTCRALGVDGWRTFCGAVLVLCAFIVYMPFYYVLATSFSVRMLLEIRRAPAGLTVSELRSRYPASRVLEGRLTTLVAARYVHAAAGRQRLTAKGRIVAATFRFIKNLWRLGPGG